MTSFAGPRANAPLEIELAQEVRGAEAETPRADEATMDLSLEELPKVPEKGDPFDLYARSDPRFRVDL
ncbi:hypothetical protein K2X96_01975 [Patescibacteria group bacterium]|nr:hypothetical protein [Patescibacteria group bacterium]